MDRIAKLVVGIISIIVSTQTLAGDLTLPNSFQAGTPAVAADVNANFNAVEQEVDDNNDRINTNTGNISTHETRIASIENTVGNLSITRTISIPAAAMSFDSADPIVDHGRGLLWSAVTSGGPQLSVKTPADYAGGDVTFSIFFQTTTSTTGVVNFFLRVRGYDSGEGQVDPGSNSCTPVTVSGTIGFGTVYEQRCTISENRLIGDWWLMTMQRGGTGATYPDDVVVMATSFEYQAVQ